MLSGTPQDKILSLTYATREDLRIGPCTRLNKNNAPHGNILTEKIILRIFVLEQEDQVHNNAVYVPASFHD
jgi:hypothetical protein